MNPRRRHLLRLLGVTGLAWSSARCTREVDPVPQDAGIDVDPFTAECDAALVVGTGRTRWVDLNPLGDRVLLTRGGQGGYHIYGRVRFSGLPPDVYIRFLMTPVGGGEPVNLPDRVRRREHRGLLPWAGGWESASPELVIMRLDPSEILGRTFLLKAVVYQAGTSRLWCQSAELTVTPEM